MAQPTSQSDKDKPRRARRTLEQREADAKEELAAIDAMRAKAIRKTLEDAIVLLRIIEKSSVGHAQHERCRQTADALADWLSSKPQEGG